MIGRRRLGTAFATVCTCLLACAAPAQQPNSPAPTVKIGMAGSLVKDVPPALVQVMTPPFQTLMKEHTGLTGEIITAGDANDLGRRLNDKEVQLAVFPGHEFAWAQHKYPELRPLVIAVSHHRTQKAYLVVRNDCGAADLAGLKGKTLALPRKTRDHCLLFLERECKNQGADAKDYFGAVVNQPSIEDALDDVLRDKVQVCVVDCISLETYEQVKPACHARLKILRESEAFPSAVVAYRQGALDAATLTKFRDGMMNASQTKRGKELMGLWKLTSFENVPADFPQTLSNILKAYPPPEPSARGKGQ
jgi:ABC-type phosphate/phosphonate transport system substrate-binding protein